jgi:outer membrane protein TolC
MKKIIGMILTLTFLLGINTYAEEQKAAPKKIEMTLEQAMKYALEHNKLIKDKKDDVTDADENYYNAQMRTSSIASTSIKTNFGDSGMAAEAEYAYYKGYTLENVKNALEQAKKLEELQEQVTSYNIQKNAFAIEESKCDLNYLIKNKKKLEKDLSIAQTKFKLQMINKNQLDQVTAAVYQMDTRIKLINDILKIRNNALKGYVGVDRNVELTIILPKTGFKEVTGVDIEAAESKAATSRIDAIYLTDGLEALEMDYKVYDYFKNQIAFDTYKTKRDNYNKAKDNYENDMNDIKQKVEYVYEALLTSEKQYLDAIDSYKIALTTNKIDKKKLSLGMISKVDFTTSSLALLKTEIDLKKALNENILANIRFQASYTVGEIDPVLAAASGM